MKFKIGEKVRVKANEPTILQDKVGIIESYYGELSSGRVWMVYFDIGGHNLLYEHNLVKSEKEVTGLVKFLRRVEKV